MDIKYGVMVFNENEIYKDFYEELYARLAKIKGQDFYFTTNNPENGDLYSTFHSKWLKLSP